MAGGLAALHQLAPLKEPGHLFLTQGHDSFEQIPDLPDFLLLQLFFRIQRVAADQVIPMLDLLWLAGTYPRCTQSLPALVPQHFLRY